MLRQGVLSATPQLPSLGVAWARGLGRYQCLRDDSPRLSARGRDSLHWHALQLVRSEAIADIQDLPHGHIL